MSETPIYTSKSTLKSLWQEYRIYDNRLEFDTLFGQMTVPFDHIEQINISGSEIRELLKGNLHLKHFRPALKLDWSNFQEHVVLDKDEGHVRRVLFTPNNPKTFKRILDEALARHQEKQTDDQD